jgi:hypothetical protein
MFTAEQHRLLTAAVQDAPHALRDQLGEHIEWLRKQITDLNNEVVSTPGATLERQGFLAVGSDGALWFTEKAARRQGRITVGGGITCYPTLRPLSQLS